MDSISERPSQNQKELKEIISLISSIIEEMKNQQIVASMHLICFALGLLFGEYIKIPHVLIFICCFLALIYCMIKLHIKSIKLFFKNIGDTSEKQDKYY